jgi:hypothetical protein
VYFVPWRFFLLFGFCRNFNKGLNASFSRPFRPAGQVP